MGLAVMEPGAVSHYREAGVNFLLMDATGLQIEAGLNGEEEIKMAAAALSCLGGESGR